MEDREVREARALIDSWEFLKDFNSVGIDIDGVLADFVSCYLGELNERFGYEYEPGSVVNWDFVKALGIPGEVNEGIWNSPGLLARMAEAPVYEVGRELVELLALTGKRIHYVTARGHTPIDEPSRHALERLTESWLINNDLPMGSVSFWHNKPEVAQYWGLKAFVEDSGRNALQLANSGTAVLLVDWPYNQEVEHEMIRRVEGWS